TRNADTISQCMGFVEDLVDPPTVNVLPGRVVILVFHLRQKLNPRVLTQGACEFRARGFAPSNSIEMPYILMKITCPFFVQDPVLTQACPNQGFKSAIQLATKAK